MARKTLLKFEVLADESTIPVKLKSTFSVYFENVKTQAAKGKRRTYFFKLGILIYFETIDNCTGINAKTPL